MLASAFMLGLLGGIHCIGMCGPIVLALPLSTTDRLKVLAQTTSYHVGRVCTYSFLGVVIGLFGWGIQLSGYQSAFTILVGVTLVLSALFTTSLESKIMRVGPVATGLAWVQKRLGTALTIKEPLSAFRVGLLNGLLPCGLVYVALAGAALSGCALHGAAYMALFGAGTLPWMIGVMFFGQYSKKHFAKLRRWLPVAILLFGLYFIYRGLMIEMPADLDRWIVEGLKPSCH